MKVIVFVKATAGSEAGEMPSAQLLTDMGKFNEQLVAAGIMKAGEGLKPSSEAARVRFSGTNRTVMDGPFAEMTNQSSMAFAWRCLFRLNPPPIRRSMRSLKVARWTCRL